MQEHPKRQNPTHYRAQPHHLSKLSSTIFSSLGFISGRLNHRHSTPPASGTIYRSWLPSFPIAAIMMRTREPMMIPATHSRYVYDLTERKAVKLRWENLIVMNNSIMP